MCSDFQQSTRFTAVPAGLGCNRSGVPVRAAVVGVEESIQEPTVEEVRTCTLTNRNRSAFRPFALSSVPGVLVASPSMSLELSGPKWVDTGNSLEILDPFRCHNRTPFFPIGRQRRVVFRLSAEQSLSVVVRS
jgi:hypothetical protein